MIDTFLRQQAVTQHFTLGQPRSFALAGGHIFFVRSQGGEDPVGCLWEAKIAEDGTLSEALIVDPAQLASDETLPDAERRRRERTREQAGGIVTYSVDHTGQKIAFALGGDLYATNRGEIPTCVVSSQSVYDPQISSNGEYIAYACDGDLKVVPFAGGEVMSIAHHDHPEVTWGLADFIAAEEIGRTRGFWWSPDSSRLLAARVDTRPMQSWYISDPSHPTRKPQETKYPAAGTPNAVVSLSIFTLQGDAIPVQWDAKKYEYLVDVQWDDGALHIIVQSRDQKSLRLLKVDMATGYTTMQHEIVDRQWVELQPGLPCQQNDKSILSWKDGSARQLVRDGHPLTPETLQFDHLCGTDEDGTLWFTAWDDDPKSWQLYELNPKNELIQLTQGEGLHNALVKDDVMVRFTRTLTKNTVIEILRRQESQWQLLGRLQNNAAVPPLTPKPRFYRTGPHAASVALLLPENYEGQQKLPVLVDSYGGPHAQLVVSAQRAYLESQWYANQGFAVLVIDGRGTPGRSPSYEKAIAGDLITTILEDQITALHEVAADDDRLDLSRVAIKGWSFGGYLAAYAVVRHPEVFHAAIAGAPVTEWRWYDTHYTERYLGDPAININNYDNSSLLKEAHKLTRPLMLIHGLADDNVAFAHTLEMSGALLAAGRSHQVLPLSGATHMPKGVDMAENLEKLQLEFLRDNL